ncbi:hypothetical protein Clacol_004041 [Clathrus columnatus]|uniref:Uncharacterized protein n=1 Tax=Clathrus columnatus TaxID=1419009 RepID=A0AAV5A835_9AGAM|nr:hypothetical protein Clacol_004041 [Clathrus columnatus]
MSTSSDLAGPPYHILNLATKEYVLRGNGPGELLHTGPFGPKAATEAVATKVFRVTRVDRGDNAQILLESATGLKPVPSASTYFTKFGLFANNCFQPDLRAVIWERFDAPWVARTTGSGQLNLGRIPEKPNTFWADVQHTVLLQPIGALSNWKLELILVTEAEAK